MQANEDVRDTAQYTTQTHGEFLHRCLQLRWDWALTICCFLSQYTWQHTAESLCREALWVKKAWRNAQVAGSCTPAEQTTSNNTFPCHHWASFRSGGKHHLHRCQQRERVYDLDCNLQHLDSRQILFEQHSRKYQVFLLSRSQLPFTH